MRNLREGTEMIPYLAKNPLLPSSTSISEQDTITPIGALSSVPPPNQFNFEVPLLSFSSATTHSLGSHSHHFRRAYGRAWCHLSVVHHLQPLLGGCVKRHQNLAQVSQHTMVTSCARKQTTEQQGTAAISNTESQGTSQGI